MIDENLSVRLTRVQHMTDVTAIALVGEASSGTEAILVNTDVTDRAWAQLHQELGRPNTESRHGDNEVEAFLEFWIRQDVIRLHCGKEVHTALRIPGLSTGRVAGLTGDFRAAQRRPLF